MNWVQLTLCTDEAIYEKADDFIPERWYSRPELVKEKSAFAPFLAGKLSPPKFFNLPTI